MTKQAADNPNPGLARRRAQLVMLALLFMAPAIAAWVVWMYVGDHGVGATTNAGQLVSPAQALPDDMPLQDLRGEPLDERALRGRWTYVLFAPPQGCDAGCRQWLFETRQLRVSINKDFPRVHRLLILPAPLAGDTLDELSQANPDLQFAVAGGAALEQVKGVFERAAPADGSRVFLVDPLGNLMMTYDSAVGFKGMFKDLRKLLKVSQIG
jgi:hypothetical protein